MFTAGADKKAEAGAGSATEFQFVSHFPISFYIGSPSSLQNCSILDWFNCIGPEATNRSP